MEYQVYNLLNSLSVKDLNQLGREFGIRLGTGSKHQKIRSFLVKKQIGKGREERLARLKKLDPKAYVDEICGEDKIDPISQELIEAEDLVVIDEKCFSKESMRLWAEQFLDKTTKVTNPLTRKELSIEEIRLLDLNPKDFIHTYKLEDTLKIVQDWLRSLGYNYNINELRNEKSLFVESNNMTYIPPEIDNLTNLTRLIFWGNKLTRLPSEIGNLTNLQSLGLRNTQISELPPSIGELRNLRELSLFDNQLTELPPSIGELRNLVFLGLDGNPLTKLPPSIGKLRNLKKLNLYNTQISELPPSIGNLRNLVFLGLGNSQLTELPPEIGKIPNLLVHPEKWYEQYLEHRRRLTNG